MSPCVWCVKCKRRGTLEVFTWSLDGVWDGTDAFFMPFHSRAEAEEFARAHKPDWSVEAFSERAWWHH